MRSAMLVIALAACGSDSSPQIDAPATPSDGGVDAAPIDAPLAVNGCTRALADDRSAPGADRVIAVTDDRYTPRCPRITVGQSITWSGNFGDHPLAPGIIRGSQLTLQPGSPIQEVNGPATTTTVTFTEAGDWAFYCPSHAPGMSGLVYVDP